MEDAKVEGVLSPVKGEFKAAELTLTVGQNSKCYRAESTQKERLEKLGIISSPVKALNPRSQGDYLSHDFAPNDIDIEKGLDQNFPSSEKGGRYSWGYVCGRLADMADLLFGINVQGAISLAGYLTLTSNSSSKGFFYLVVFLYGLGFLTALGGKLFCSTRVGLIGSMATILAFLINMSLLIIYKI